MSNADFQRAISILTALQASDPQAPAKILSVPLDFNEFVNSNRLALDETEVRELKSYFRA